MVFFFLTFHLLLNIVRHSNRATVAAETVAIIVDVFVNTMSYKTLVSLQMPDQKGSPKAPHPILNLVIDMNNTI